MLRLALSLSFSISLAGLISVTPSGAYAQSVVDWTMARTTVKVRPDHPMLPQKAYWLMAAKNDFASIQVILDLSQIQSGGSGSEFCVTTSELVNGTNKIHESNIHVFRAAPIVLNVRSSVEGGTGIFYDPLIPRGTWSMPALSGSDVIVRGPSQLDAFSRVDQSHEAKGVFWIEIFIPESASAGVYAADIVFKPNGCQSSENEWAIVPLRVLVAPFALPQTSTLTSSIEWTVDEACRAHFGRECNGPDIPTLNGLYGRFLLEHRLTPWLSYTPYHETGGSPDYNADWDDYVQTYKPLVEGNDSSFATARRLKDAVVTSIRYPVSGEDFEPAPMGIWWSRLGTEISTWQEKAFVKLGDEPEANGTWPVVKANLATVKNQVDDTLRTMVTASLEKANAEGGLEQLDIIVPLVGEVDSQSQGYLWGDYETFLADESSREVWTYQSCMSYGCNTVGSDPGWPSLMIDVAVGLQNRAEPWMIFLYGRRPDCDNMADGNGLSSRPCFSGMHYYDVVNWADGIKTEESGGTFGSPYLGASGDRTSILRAGGNGDGLLIYPGTAEHLGPTMEYTIPIASHRLKLLREGLEDFEWLVECGKFDEQQAVDIAKTLFPTANGKSDGHMYNVVNGRSEDQRGKDLAEARKRLYLCAAQLPDNLDDMPLFDTTAVPDGLGG